MDRIKSSTNGIYYNEELVKPKKSNVRFDQNCCSQYVKQQHINADPKYCPPIKAVKKVSSSYRSAAAACSNKFGSSVGLKAISNSTARCADSKCCSSNRSLIISNKTVLPAPPFPICTDPKCCPSTNTLNENSNNIKLIPMEISKTSKERLHQELSSSFANSQHRRSISQRFKSPGRTLSSFSDSDFLVKEQQRNCAASSPPRNKQQRVVQEKVFTEEPCYGYKEACKTAGHEMKQLQINKRLSKSYLSIPHLTEEEFIANKLKKHATPTFYHRIKDVDTDDNDLTANECHKHGFAKKLSSNNMSLSMSHMYFKSLAERRQKCMLSPPPLPKIVDDCRCDANRLIKPLPQQIVNIDIEDCEDNYDCGDEGDNANEREYVW